MNSCNCNKCNDCGSCNTCGCENRCRCAKPVISVESLPDNLGMVKYNFDGVSTYYDHTNMIKQLETDTTLSADTVRRVLTYMAERHIDTISAKELGSILHLADISDVDVTNLEEGSILVYNKNTDCSEGCEGINNTWKAWDSASNRKDYLQTVMGFDEEDKPYALNTPANANQFYQLGWNANNKVSYSQPQDTTIGGVTKDGKVAILVMDQTTKQIMSLKVDAAKLGELL